MSAKTMPSLRDENRDLRKQIGCMNGIFQIFDRHHFLTGRRISSRSNKRLLQGSQHQVDQPYATKTVTVKDVEVQREKPRMSSESSRASFSSSSCSSTFSSLDTNRTAQAETLSRRQINIPDSQFQSSATKEHQPSSTKGVQSHDLRDIVKDSMHREARSLSIKSLSHDERRGTVMKHIDSPRPPQQSKIANPKATGHLGPPRILAKVQEGTKHSKDERLTLPRFSYDGRESRELYKSSVKHKELPRLSLDSKTATMKALESRLSFLGRDLHVGNDASRQVVPLNQEPETHRSSSVVAKLMGLDTFPDTPTIKACPKEACLSELTSTPGEIKQNQVNCSPRASPSPKLQSASFARKPTTCSRFPVEPAPWRQQDSSQGSPKMGPKNRKAPTSILHQTSSVYGEIEKRITELEFKKSSKDLRALKQILEAMQKTREQLEEQQGDPAEFTLQRRCSFEDSCADPNSNLSMWKNRRTYHQVHSIKGPCPPKQTSSVVIMKAKPSVTSRVPTMEISHLQRLQTRTPKYKGSSAHSQKTNDLTPEINNVKYRNWHHLTTDKKNTSEGPQHMKSENCTTPGRSSGTVSPRLQRSLLRIEGQSHSTTLSSDSGRVKKQCSKRNMEKGSLNRKVKVKAKDQQLSDDQLSEISSDTRYSSYQGDTASVKSESNNSLISQTETEIISMAHSINTAARQKQNSASTTRNHMAAVESAIAVLEQPSPISVLDDAFYCEDSPSPVKKISTVFQGTASLL
ncbi:hypothetical protein ACS0TY_029122 [Phlomoides rotata]